MIASLVATYPTQHPGATVMTFDSYSADPLSATNCSAELSMAMLASIESLFSCSMMAYSNLCTRRLLHERLQQCC